VNIVMLDVIVDPTRPGASGLSDLVWHMARELTALGDHIAIVGAYAANAPLPPGNIRVHRLAPPPSAVARLERLGVTIVHASVCAARALQRLPPPDVVYTPDFVSGGIAARLAPQLPVVCSTQGNIYERLATNSNPFGWPRTQIYKVATHLAVTYAAHIVTPSEAMADWWRRSGAPPSRTSVIPVGTDVAFYRPEPRARARLGIGEEVELVLFAARFSPEKNASLVLRAVAALAPSRPALRLHLCGTGPDEADLRSLVRKLGLESIVTFAGWVDRERIRDYYSAATVFVLPSISEPLARVMLDAMACQTFVVATAVGGSADVIDHGRNGLLLPPRDVETWRDAIAHALEDPAWRLRLAAAGRTTMVERFSWPTIARRLRDEVFLRVIETQAARTA
jgi:glycosyltransferase involved in cell wall biosynthesis